MSEQTPETVRTLNGVAQTDTDKKGEKKIPPMFGPCTFAAREGQPYDIKGGARGTTAIVATVPLYGGQMAALVNISVRYDPKLPADRNTVISASKPQTLNFDSAALKDRFLGHVETSAAKWKGFDDAVDDAIRRIAASYSAKSDKDTGKADARPRLVRATKIAAQTNPAA